MKRERVLILGAAGRDFHNFNVFFRKNEHYEVVGFTAAQIPRIDNRSYPPELAGKLYPKGIPIFKEADLEKLVLEHGVAQVVLAYSDLKYETVMHLASRAHAAGADFRLLGPARTMIEAKVPVIAICAVRTGCGKSQTARYASRLLRKLGKKVVAIRHPMPYGNLKDQRVQRFEKYEDLAPAKCTIEEREEYEPLLLEGNVIYAGVDYHAILESAQREADIVIWDGGNNDTPFIRPDLWITVLDPLRPGHETSYYPSEVNFRRAGILLINKADVATHAALEQLREQARQVNPDATVVTAASRVMVDDPAKIKGKRVLLVEDGPTLTHGGMPFGAGQVAANKCGAAEVIEPRPYAVGSIKDCYRQYPTLGKLIPALGYYDEQIRDLEKTINKADCDVVLIATPIDLGRIIKINKPTVRVTYELEDMGKPTLSSLIKAFVAK